MFTAKPQKNRAAATRYFDEHLSHNDYYTEQETQAGYWIGKGVERLGLEPGGNVNREDFLGLCDNRHPGTGGKLTQMQLTERRIFFDFTCSAPKSVSILAVTMGDRRIADAHREAADIALRELEAFAAARVRKGGAMDDRVTGNLVGAAFQHTSSRALDPQLHVHFTLFNATFDPVERRWKALQTSGMFGAIHYGTAVYRNELARRLHALGYATRQTAHGFEIEGVEPKLIERFSKRAQERRAAVAKEERRLGRRLTNDEISHLVHRSRPKKLKNISAEAVRQAQLSELSASERQALRVLVASANGQQVDPAERVTASEAISHAVEHTFSRRSVAPEHVLLEAALVKGCGQLDLPELKRSLTGSPELFRAGRELSTRAILNAEVSLIGTVNRGLDAAEPIAPGHNVTDSLGADQRAALKLVLSSCDTITGIQGLAGAGKTTALRELEKAVQRSGRDLFVCAPSAAATDVLRKEGFAQAVTVAKLLTNPVPLPRRSVLVVDEAGTLGTADMVRVFAAAKDARVVLVGDTGQHAPVAQGDALRIIEQHSGYRFGRLTEIRRQRSEDLKQTVALAAARASAEAFQRLEAAGEVIEEDETEALHARVADDYCQTIAAGRSALIVSPTWAEIADITEAVREKLRTQRRIGSVDEEFEVFDPLGWTDAQKRLLSHYEPGMQLRFVRKSGQFRAGDIIEVVGQHGKQLQVGSADGRAGSFGPGRAPASFEIGRKRSLPIAAGDVLLLRANGQNFVNGERVTVRDIDGRNIVLTDGRTLPENYRAFTHGYAVTSHSAQGKTVDEVFVVASSQSFAAVSQEQFYVGISRARERARIYTDDAALLGRRVEDSRTRKAAIELARESLKPEMRQAVAPFNRAWRQMRSLRVDRFGRAQHVRQQMLQSHRQAVTRRPSQGMRM